MSDRGEFAPRAWSWLDLFRCFRMASDPVKIWFGFLGVIFSVMVFVVVSLAIVEVRSATGGTMSGAITDCMHAGDVGGAAAAVRESVCAVGRDARRDLRRIRSSFLTNDLARSLCGAETLALVVGSGLIAMLLMNAPWAYYGGAISRSAAVESATGERTSGAELRDFAGSRRSSYFWPPVIVTLAVAGVLATGVLVGLAAGHLLSAAVVIVGGFVSLYVLVVVKQKTRSPRTGRIAGLACGVIVVLCAWSLWDVRCLWLGRIGAVVALPFVFAAAVVALVLLVVLILGRGLMASAVSFEGSDSFDAVTRAGDYVLRRPWRLGFYWLAATLYGIPCTLFVAGLVVGAMFLAVSLLWMGIGNSFADTYAGFLAIGQGAGLSESVPSFLLGAVVVILGGLVAGWCVSFVQCYRAISYALLRQSVDHSRPSEVFLESGAAPPRSPGPSRPQQ